MRSCPWSGPAVLAGILAFAPAVLPSSGDASRRSRGPSRPSRAAPPPAKVDLPFPGIEPNRGQADPAARFVARAPRITAFLAATEAHLLLGDPRVPADLRRARPNALRRPEAPDPVLLRLRFPGASAGASLEPADPLPGVSHYFLGNDPAAWARNVPRFGRLKVRGLWPGVDLEYGARRDGLEYRFTVAPGADPRTVRLLVEGGGAPAVAPDGSLVVATPGGEMRHSPPVLWQEREGGRDPVPGRFAIREGGAMGIEVGAFDRRRPLVIDPTVSYATYLGGSGDEYGWGVAADSAGATYVSGRTTSTNFKLSAAFQGTNAGGTADAFVTKIHGTTGNLVYSTYLGGAGLDVANGLALDGSGAAYLAGVTSSSDFPRQGAFQNSYGSGTYDGFVTKVAADGASLSYSTYLGGYLSEACFNVAVDGNGAAYVTGWTSSTNFPVVAAFRPVKYGVYDGFVTKFNAQGSALAYSTFLGGSGDNDTPVAIRVDGSGNAAVAGYTDSADFPTYNARQAIYMGGDGPVPNDAFACVIDSLGAGVLYSTYVGGTGYDDCTAMDMDSSGNVYLTGYTDSTDFPGKNSLQLDNQLGPHDGYLLKLRFNGSLDFGTYLGGSEYDEPIGVAVAATGTVHLCGLTTSTDFPTANPLQASYGGGTFDAFAALFHPTGSALLYSTYAGTGGDEAFQNVALDTSGNPHFYGYTSSSSFPVQDAYQSSFAGGNWDAVVVRYRLTLPAAPANLTAAALSDRQILLSWSDLSSTETGFDIERRSGTSSFRNIATTNANARSFVDAQVLPESTYTYRVSARNVDGLSVPTNEASATTLASPTPPAAPGGVGAVAASATEIDVSWDDNSDDEQTFYLQRRLGDLPVTVARTFPKDSTSGRDSGLLPGRTYAYRIRAANSAGSTTSTDEAAATTDSNIAVTLSKGSLTARGEAGKDKVKVTGVLAVPGSGIPGAPYDPEANGFTLGIGNEDDPLLASVVPYEIGWKLSRGKYSWKSPKGAAFKAKISLDTVSGKFSVSVSGVTFPEAPAGPVWVWFRVGADAGARTDSWRPGKKTGTLSY